MEAVAQNDAGSPRVCQDFAPIGVESGLLDEGAMGLLSGLSTSGLMGLSLASFVPARRRTGLQRTNAHG